MSDFERELLCRVVRLEERIAVLEIQLAEHEGDPDAHAWDDNDDDFEFFFPSDF